MTQAFIPERDLPNFDGKQRDVTTTMARLAERARLGKFLKGRPEADSFADRFQREQHEAAHQMVRGWARPPHRDDCGRCVLGDDIWERYEAGLIQPVEVVEARPVVRATPKKFPELPVEGFIRAARLLEQGQT